MKFTLGTSMWFWSVSWPTNCPVNFSFFLVGQKKIDPSQRPDIFFLSTLLIFLSGLDIREWPIFKKREWAKKIVRSLRRDNFLSANQKKMRKRPNNWLTKRLTKTTWTGLEYQNEKMDFKDNISYSKHTVILEYFNIKE